MPRKPRLFVPGATYHVYCRVARGEFVFDEPFEADCFVETVRKVGGLHHWKVLAWCLMGNHYHLVVKTSSIPLWRTMQRLQCNVGWVPHFALTLCCLMGATLRINALLPREQQHSSRLSRQRLTITQCVIA